MPGSAEGLSSKTHIVSCHREQAVNAIIKRSVSTSKSILMTVFLEVEARGMQLEEKEENNGHPQIVLYFLDSAL